MPELTDREYRRFLEVLDRDAIRDVLARVSRGVDRLNAEILRSAYWPDAVIYASGFYEGPIEEFIKRLLAAYKDPQIGAAHNICNIKVDVEGDIAWGETYFLGTSENRPDNADPFNSLSSGRYLDKFEKRDGEWRILQRTFVFEWTTRLPHHTAWTQPPLVDIMRRGRRDDKDVVFKMRKSGFPNEG